MHIDTATLAKAITRACVELHRLDAAAAEGEIGRIGARRLLLRIEPAGADWAGREIPLPPGAEISVRDADAPVQWPIWQTDDGCWIDAVGIRIDLAPLRIGDDKSREVECLTQRIRALAETAGTAESALASSIRSPLNACCHRDACRELLLALELIRENPDHDLLPTERETAEAAIAKATGEG